MNGTPTWGGIISARWRASGLDPEGLDLLAGDSSARVVFAQRAGDSQSLERALEALGFVASAR